MKVAGRGGRKLSLAGIVAYRIGDQPRVIYRTMAHRGRKGEPKGFGEHHFADLLDAAHQHLGAPIVLVWDGLPAHKSAKMRALIAARPWLRVYRLPGYAPELNPVENMWSSLKRGMANLAPRPDRRPAPHRQEPAQTDAVPAHPRLRIPRHQLAGTTLTLTPKAQ